MDVLVISEIRQGNMKKATSECLGVAKEVASATGGTVSALIYGTKTDCAKSLAGLGASAIYHADSGVLDTYSTEAYSAIASKLIQDKKFGLVLAGATNYGKDLMPRIAARIGAGLATDCTAVSVENGRITVKRPIYAGKLTAGIGFKSETVLATLRPNVFCPPAYVDSVPNIIKIDANVSENNIRARVVDTVKSGGDAVELTEATIVVSGGRGMKAQEHFKMLEELAGVIGAAVGASRAAVDSGWKPQSQQVGQTGKVVTPNLYIACGISGAIQHLAGMSTSKCIVAINKDKNAPIFKVCDYGIVGDVFQIVPAMTKEVRKLKESGQ